MEPIVDYVEIVEDANGHFRVRARSKNGRVIWTTEQYGDRKWAEAVAADSGKTLLNPTP
jgi:uncharacterized protein YegP (UPF0339 family)